MPCLEGLINLFFRHHYSTLAGTKLAQKKQKVVYVVRGLSLPLVSSSRVTSIADV